MLHCHGNMAADGVLSRWNAISADAMLYNHTIHPHHYNTITCMSEYYIIRQFNPEVRMQSKNAIAIVHAMASMWGMHKLLYFLEKTPRLLFISALPQCGDYSRVATIRSTDTAATIYFSSTQCGDYSRVTTIRSTDVAATIYFSSTAMW